MSRNIHICSFSSAAAELSKKLRNESGVLQALKVDPYVSTFDMSEKVWLRKIIARLEDLGLIKRVDNPYPWCKWLLTEGVSDEQNI